MKREMFKVLFVVGFSLCALLASSELMAQEPVSCGGFGTGPNPFTLSSYDLDMGGLRINVSDGSVSHSAWISNNAAQFDAVYASILQAAKMKDQFEVTFGTLSNSDELCSLSVRPTAAVGPMPEPTPIPTPHP